MKQSSSRFRPAGAGTRVYDDSDSYQLPRSNFSGYKTSKSSSNFFSSSNSPQLTQNRVFANSSHPDPPEETRPNISDNSNFEPIQHSSFTYSSNQSTSIPRESSKVNEGKDPDDVDDQLTDARMTIGKVQGLLSKLKSNEASTYENEPIITSDLTERIQKLRNLDPVNSHEDEILSYNNRNSKNSFHSTSPTSYRRHSSKTKRYHKQSSAETKYYDAEEEIYNSNYDSEIDEDRDEFSLMNHSSRQNYKKSYYNDSFSIELPAIEDICSNSFTETSRTRINSEKQNGHNETDLSVTYYVDLIDNETVPESQSRITRWGKKFFSVIQKTMQRIIGKNESYAQVYFYKGSYLDEDFIRSTGEMGRRIKAKKIRESDKEKPRDKSRGRYESYPDIPLYS